MEGPVHHVFYFAPSSHRDGLQFQHLLLKKKVTKYTCACQLFRDIAQSNWQCNIERALLAILFFTRVLNLPISSFFFFSLGIILVISECSSVYCLNGGTCRDEPSGYKCDCRFGFYGKRCEGKFSWLICSLHVTPGKETSSVFPKLCRANKTMMMFAFDCFRAGRFQSMIRNILK